MAETTQNNKEQAILEAAEREFLTKGFDGARTTSIAAAAGVTHAMLHYYFRTKEHIFERILNQKIGLMGQLIITSFGEPGRSLPERIRVGIGRHYDFLLANPDLPRFLINEIATKPERYAFMRKQVEPIVGTLRSRLQRELDALADSGEIEHMDVRHLMLDILSLNIFSFIAYPIIEPLIGDMAADQAEFHTQRKKENIETILRRLKINKL